MNKELLTEMNEEIEKGNFAGAKNIAKDITDNEEKINHHGKRADAIVKGMLQHSRNSNGQKELTNINALADGYLRLAYHGLRAKEKDFNATLQTNFYDSILDKNGERETRKGVKLTWIDIKENKHDLDFVLERGGTPTQLGTPVAFIKTARRRYTKHSRNKEQEIQGAILPLIENRCCFRLRQF